MKKIKKLSLSKKLERKIVRLVRIINSQDRQMECLKTAIKNYEDQKGTFVKANKEQERIIDMFKSCLDRNLLEKILKDDYIRFLKEMRLETMPDMFACNQGPSFKYEPTTPEDHK